MKTSIFVTALMLAVISTAFAGRPNSTSAAEMTEATQYIESQLVIPDALIFHDGYAVVCFELRSDLNNQVEVLPIANNNEKLNNTVNRQLKRMEKQLAKRMKPGTNQKIRLIVLPE